MGKRKAVPKPPQPEAAAGGSAPSRLRHCHWLLPFALFLVLRLFSSEANFLLAGDQCTFLGLGRTFPKHQLFNHELYLIHSPLFGYAIGLLHAFLPLLASGLLATLIFACVNFFALRRLAQVEELPRAAIFAGLIYLAISRPAVAYDYHVARVSILVCFTTLALLAFLNFLRTPGTKTLLVVIAANAICLFSTDQALLLLPCEAAIFFARGGLRQWRSLSLLAAASACAALIWPVVRFFEFSRRGDLPAGISGTIEFTAKFPLLAVLQPNFLPFTNTHRSLFTQTSLSLSNLKLDLLTALPVDLLLIPRWLSVAIVVLLIAAALSRPARRPRAIVWLGLSIFLLLPVGLGMNEWYGMAFIVPFALLIMEGAAACLAWAAPYASEKAVAIGLSLACVLGAVLWLAASPPPPHGLLAPHGGPYFLLARPPVTRGSEALKFFTSLPRDTGIMAPTDLSPEVAYLTDKRVLALPFDPALLDKFIAEYRIAYIVTSSEFMRRYASPMADKYTSSLVNRFVAEHPGRFRPVYSLREAYPDFYNPTDYYVLQVQK